MASENETGLANFVCIVFEQGDEMLTLLCMEKQMVECNLEEDPKVNCFHQIKSLLKVKCPSVLLIYLWSNKVVIRRFRVLLVHDNFCVRQWRSYYETDVMNVT